MGWRQRTRAAIRAYPDLRRRERELRESSVTVSYDKIGGRSSNVGRGVEATAIRELPREDQRELDAVSTALQTTMRYRNGGLRVKIIDLVYWRRSHTLTGAALEVHVSAATAKAWHNDFVELVDAYLRIL